MDTLSTRLTECRETKGVSLDLSGLKIDKIPEELTNFEWVKDLRLSRNKITTIEHLPPNISQLHIDRNKIKKIPEGAFPDTIEMLNVVDNDIAVLEHLPKKLKKLLATGNTVDRIRELPVTLTYIDLCNNVVEDLPNTLSDHIIYLDISYNPIRHVDKFPLHLEELDISNCEIEALINLPTKLTVLRCSGSGIKILGKLPIGLREIDCSTNELSDLPHLPESLVDIDCSSNYLSALPNIPKSLSKINISNNKFKSIPPELKKLPDGKLYAGGNPIDDEGDIGGADVGDFWNTTLMGKKKKVHHHPSDDDGDSSDEPFSIPSSFGQHFNPHFNPFSHDFDDFDRPPQYGFFNQNRDMFDDRRTRNDNPNCIDTKKNVIV